MPTLETINRLKSQLLEIGDEPSILAERGEIPIDIEPLETGLPEDLNELLGDDMEEDDLSLGKPEDDFDFQEGEESSAESDTGLNETSEIPGFTDMVPEAASLEDALEDFTMDDTNVLEAGFGMEEQEEQDLSTGEEEFALPEIDEGIEETAPDFSESMDDFAVSDVAEAATENIPSPDIERALEPEEIDLSMDDGKEETDFDQSDTIDEFSIPEADESSETGDLDLGEFQLADDESLEEDFEVDEFNLGDLGQDFGVLDEAEELNFTAPEDSASTAGGTSSQGEGNEEPGEEESFQISEDDFQKLKTTLNNLPRNLKIAIEEEIGDKNLSGSKLRRLTGALIAGKSPKEIALITSNITGRKIKIPSRFEKRSGINFQEEKDSFSYIFRHTILPLIRMLLLGLVALSALTFLGYKFVYKPVRAYILYNKGYSQLEEQHYTLADEYFDRAAGYRVIKKQFFRYALGFRDKKQWNLAEKKYDQLLEKYPLDKKGTLAYAGMEFNDLYHYEKASSLLEKFLKDHVTDYDALLLYGDVNLEWGGKDPSRYEAARRAYARIMKNYGVENKILFRMMKYFIRTDNAKQVEILKQRFQADKDLKVDPAVYAELAEYQIDRNDLDDVKDILFRAKNVTNTLPEIHYQLARYFRKTGDTGEEDKALSQALHYLKEKEPLSQLRLEEKIDVFRRLGERSYAKQEYIHAQEYYNEGIALLEKSRELNLIHPQNPVYGKMYADQGDVYYFINGDLNRALKMYDTAEKESYYSPSVYYNKGYIYYTKKNFKKSLLNFYNAAGNFSTNTNLLFTTANTMYQSNDLFLAEGYYNHLLDIMNTRLNAEIPLQLNYRKDQQKLLNDLVKATNNLGVTLYGLYERTGNSEKFTRALVLFTESEDYYDMLTRNQETMKRTNSINLAFLNQKKLLYPVKGYSLQIYKNIQKDMSYLSFD